MKKKQKKLNIVKATKPKLKKEIGKIRAVITGLGGQGNHYFGFTFFLGSEKSDWGATDFWGSAHVEIPKGAEWTEIDRAEKMCETNMKVASLLKTAKKMQVAELVNLPIEATFQEGQMIGWKLLEEVL